MASRLSRPSTSSGLDAAEFDGSASIAFSDAASERTSKPRSQAPFQRPPSAGGVGGGGDSSRPTSDSNLDASFSKGAHPDEGTVSVAPSERSSRPRTSAPLASSVNNGRGGGGGGGGSRLASETNFAFGAGDDDDAASSASDRPSKSRSSAQPQAQRPPSLSGGQGRGLASESSLGGISIDNDGGASVAPSKPRSSPAPSQSGAPPYASSKHDTSASNLGFSGFSTGISGSKESDADEAPPSGQSAKKSPGSAVPSTAPSKRAPSSTGTPGSRKPSEVNPSRGGDSIAGDASIAFSDAASELGGGSSKAIPPAPGTRSARASGASGGISQDKGDDEPAPSSRRRSSFASSLRNSIASSKKAASTADSEEYSMDVDGEGEATAAVSRRESTASGGGAGGHDATSTRSSVSAAASAKGRASASSRVLSASTSVRSLAHSAHSAAPSSHHTVASARSTAKSSTKTSDDHEYEEDDDFEEEAVVEDNDNGSGPAQGASRGGGSRDAGASESVASSSRRTTAASGGRALSAASRQSTGRSARAASTSAGGGGGSTGGYSQDFDGESNTGARSSSVATPAAAASTSVLADAAASEDAAGPSPAAGGSSILHESATGGPSAPSVSGSIFQAQQPGGGSHDSHHTPSVRRSGTSVFRRLPADAPDDVAGANDRQMRRSGSSMRGGGGSQADSDLGGGGTGAAGEWNEGAIRVAAPGAPRPHHARQEGSYGGGARPRPMSAAPRDRQAAIVDGLTRKHPATWDATDVAIWVELLGLGQYRRRFLHHCIDGRLLLRIADAQLKSDLGIGPVGHRCAILDAAATLVKSYKDAQRDRLANGGADDDVDAGTARQEYSRPSTAPRSRPRPASALPGSLMTPPPPGATASPPTAHGPRRPASASRSVIPPDPYLGPAQGKVTVYEQRAKLLFELDRAQARAEQHRALAEQLQYTATLSSDEVAHIRGLLAEIERKNRAAFELSGGVDSSARVPWRHVGSGTKHTNWNPERFARPGDPETVDLTFQPRCTTAESRKLLGLGGGDYGEHSSAVNSFLDRLNNDLRKRAQGRKELERRYYPDGPADPAAQTNADFAFVAEALQARCHVALGRDPAEYEPLIDEAMAALSKNESWREAGLRDGPICAAKGPAKLAAAAGALRSLAFMERYRSDLKSKGSRHKALEKKWINQMLGPQYLPGGKDGEDLAEAAKFFALLGWRDGEGNPAEDAVDPELLDKLLDRAIEYRKRYDAWWERVRDKPEDRAAGYKCDINWSSHPWGSDGLGALMAAEMRRMGEATGGPSDFVEFTVQLLGKCREDDLFRLHSQGPRPKRLGVYRAIRTQKFIEFTQKDLEERDRKLRQAYQALVPPRRKLESSRIEGFFERLLDDAAKRRAKAEKIAHDKVQREQEILASSVMYGRHIPRPVRR